MAGEKTIYNLGINTTLSRKLLHFPPDEKVAQTIAFSAPPDRGVLFYVLQFNYINSLTAIGGRDRQFFDKLLWGLVTSTIFVRW